MSTKTETLEEKKKRLEAELENIQTDLEQSVGRLKGDVRSKMSVVHWVKKYPLQSIGAGVLVGFILAGRKKSGKGKKSEHEFTQMDSDEVGLLPLVSSELKRMLTRKATTWLVDKMEDLVENKLRNSGKGENGSAEM